MRADRPSSLANESIYSLKKILFKMTKMYGLSLAFLLTSVMFKKNRAFLLLCISPLLFTVASAGSVGFSNVMVKDTCDSKIYCTGELLKTVQLSNIFKDSKTFVDLIQRNDPEVTLKIFDELMKKTNNKPTETELATFVNATFIQEDEFEDWIPNDYTEEPSILKRIQDPQFRKFAKELNSIWKTLARKIKPEVSAHPTRHSLIPVKNGIIIPGGRFREYYYWDSYWIIKGLLLSDMKITARGMIENFVDFIDYYGFMANGGRVYYLMRSQPPLLTYMVQTYVDATQDYAFMEKVLPILDREFEFWEQKRTVDINYHGKTYKMARYYVEGDGPRPESYREDYKLAQALPTNAAKKELYENIKTGAETGWDFSARWFISPTQLGQSPQRNISHIATKYIIPVDLNSFLERNAKRLSKFHARLGNIWKSLYYNRIAARYRLGIQTLLWNNKDGTWYDYDIRNNRQRDIFYPSNFAPLYTKSYDVKYKIEYAQRAVEYIKRKNITSYLGGTPTSLDETGEQWDFPNAWSPLQSMVILGLRETGWEPALILAQDFATRWLRSNYEGYLTYKEMFEKYDAVRPGVYGGGGEYNVQSGFGWTNGVVFELLDVYCSATSNDNVVVPNIDCKPLSI